MKADTIIPDQYLAASNAQSCYSSVDICYYIAFGIYCFFHLLERTNYNSILGVSIDSIGKISTALMLVFVCARLATVRFQLTGFVRSAIVLSASLLVFTATRSWICLSLAMFVVAGKDIDVKPMVVTMLVTTILVVALVFFGVYTGVIANIASRRPGEFKVRNSLGFNQVNALGAAAARIYVSCVVLLWKKRPIFQMMLAVILVGFLEIAANSRTSELLIIVLAAVQSACYRRKNQGKQNARRVYLICLLLIWATVLLTFVFLFYFNSSNAFMVWMSNLLSNRLYSAWYICKTYGVHLFGNGDMELGQTIWAVDSYALLTIDNAWAQWLVMYGSVPTALILIGVTSLYVSAMKSGQIDGRLIVMAMLLSVYAFGETTALAIDYNPLLVLLGIPVFGCSNINANNDMNCERA